MKPRYEVELSNEILQDPDVLSRSASYQKYADNTVFCFIKMYGGMFCGTVYDMITFQPLENKNEVLKNSLDTYVFRKSQYHFMSKFYNYI